jgi:hypothetical protein
VKELTKKILKALGEAQREKRRVELGSLTLAVGARRHDVRLILSQLHNEGYFDVLSMRLTLTGFALATSVS